MTVLVTVLLCQNNNKKTLTTTKKKKKTPQTTTTKHCKNTDHFIYMHSMVQKKRLQNNPNYSLLAKELIGGKISKFIYLISWQGSKFVWYS